MIIFVTYCSAKKDESLRGTGKVVAPDLLYTSSRISRFVKACNEKRVDWAIFSDKYGVLFPDSKVGWYDKAPESVTDEEFRSLLKNFDEKLRAYDEIAFYYEKESFCELYRRLLEGTELKGRVRMVERTEEIG